MRVLTGITFLLLGLFYGCGRINFSNRLDLKTSAKGRALFSSECEGAPCFNDSPFLVERKTSDEGYLTEVFKIDDREDLEIIFVVDTSPSMDDDLKKIGERLLPLLSHIPSKRWRIAFITADHGDHSKEALYSLPSDDWESYAGSFPRFGQFMALEKQGQILDQKILRASSGDFNQIFKDTLTREIAGDYSLPPFGQGENEQPLRSLQSAILRVQTDSVHQQFFKANTDTVAIIITDEDERNSDTLRATKAQDVIDTYNRQFKDQRKRLFGFSISIQDEQCLEKEKQTSFFTESAARYGRIVGRLAELTHGSNISLCEEDYSKALNNISKKIKRLITSITLEKLFYIPNTLKVRIQPEPSPPVSWKLSGRHLIFSHELPVGTTVHVRYKYEK